MNRKLILLALLLMMTCKGLSMGRLTGNRVSGIGYQVFDSVAIIAPKGYVLLTTDGARRALAVKAEAEMLRAMNATKDDLLKNHNSEREMLVEKNGRLKRKVFWQIVEIWGLRIAVVGLIVRPLL